MKTQESANPHANQTKNRAIDGFTRIELVVVLIVIVAVCSVMIPFLSRSKERAEHMQCVNNLKQIGVAYRVWSSSHFGMYPSLAPITGGGWHELLSGGNAGRYCWKNYALMSNELGLSARVLVCPSDERLPAAAFKDFTNNAALSYFVGPSADDSHPSSLLGGDRNLAPGIVPRNDYGCSPKDGNGNDVVIKGPACWSLKMHSHGSVPGSGDILLGDGSVQEVSSADVWPAGLLGTNSLGAVWTATTTNSSGVRLIFP